MDEQTNQTDMPDLPESLKRAPVEKLPETPVELERVYVSEEVPGGEPVEKE